MQNNIPDNVIKAVANGQLIRAIKLLRQAENIDLQSAKKEIESLAAQINAGRQDNFYVDAKNKSNTPLVHSHAPARNQVNNVEKNLPTEAFLFLQKGEVKEALRVLKETRGLGLSAASNLAKKFYGQHPEYQSKEIEQLMSSRVSNSSPSKTSTTKSKRKKKSNLVEMIVFMIIIFIFLKNIFA